MPKNDETLKLYETLWKYPCDISIFLSSTTPWPVAPDGTQSLGHRGHLAIGFPADAGGS